MREHVDSHYCLALVKCAKQFASTFADMLVVISQDDKAKISFGIPAVGRTFHTLQSINEPTGYSYSRSRFSCRIRTEINTISIFDDKSK